MHVISPRAIRDAQSKHHHSASALTAWLRLLEANNFKSFAELKQTFSSVDKVGKFCVFDVGGNKLRIITVIHFNRGKIYVRAVLTHKEYDQGYWSKL
ncbi:MAG: type II toxin-antitoxin system HigB family toxin [Gammaproteobacteria bacterium]